MKIKEGGGMDIQKSKELSFDTQDFPKEVWVFDVDNLDQGTEISHLMMSHAEEYTKDELLVICRKAAMVIDQLRTDLAKAQAVPEWISVEDRLPEKGEMVYGYAAKHNYTCPVVFNGKKFYNEGLADNSISHWHYLAKPMKVQEPAND